jgi:hypothetical protein
MSFSAEDISEIIDAQSPEQQPKPQNVSLGYAAQLQLEEEQANIPKEADRLHDLIEHLASSPSSFEGKSRKHGDELVAEEVRMVRGAVENSIATQRQAALMLDLRLQSLIIELRLARSD